MDQMAMAIRSYEPVHKGYIFGFAPGVSREAKSEGEVNPEVKVGGDGGGLEGLAVEGQEFVHIPPIRPAGHLQVPHVPMYRPKDRSIRVKLRNALVGRPLVQSRHRLRISTKQIKTKQHNTTPHHTQDKNGMRAAAGGDDGGDDDDDCNGDGDCSDDGNGNDNGGAYSLGW